MSRHRIMVSHLNTTGANEIPVHFRYRLNDDTYMLTLIEVFNTSFRQQIRPREIRKKIKQAAYVFRDYPLRLWLISLRSAQFRL